MKRVLQEQIPAEVKSLRETLDALLTDMSRLDYEFTSHMKVAEHVEGGLDYCFQELEALKYRLDVLQRKMG